MPTTLRWINVCVITLLVVVCTWLLFTRGEEVFPGHTHPQRLPLLPFVLLASAAMIASGASSADAPSRSCEARRR